MLGTTLAAAALAAAALAASGCGESSSKGGSATNGPSTTTSAGAPQATTTKDSVASLPNVTPVKLATGTPLSRAQFVARAEAICTRTNAKIAATTLITTKEATRDLPQTVAYYALETRELSKLVPPAALAHDWATIVNDFHTIEEYSQAVARYARANNFRAAAPYVRGGNRVLERLNRLAAHDGFKKCAGLV